MATSVSSATGTPPAANAAPANGSADLVDQYEKEAKDNLESQFRMAKITQESQQKTSYLKAHTDLNEGISKMVGKSGESIKGLV